MNPGIDWAVEYVIDCTFARGDGPIRRRLGQRLRSLKRLGYTVFDIHVVKIRIFAYLELEEDFFGRSR